MTTTDPVAAIEGELLGPGGDFELVEAEILGERMMTFRHQARDLREVLEASAAYGDREFVAFDPLSPAARRFSFAEHLGLVASTAAVMRDRYDIRPGDRVAILASNCPEWIVTFWATISLGAIAVGLNAWWAADEIRYALADCEPKLLVADVPRLHRLREGEDGRELSMPVVVIEDGFDALWHEHADARLPDVAIGGDDRCLVLYTSGTTGRPKGAVHTHRNMAAFLRIRQYNFARGIRLGAAAAAAAGRAPGPPSPPCVLMCSPLFHVSGLHNGAVALLSEGTRSVWTVGRFDPGAVLQIMEKERCTSWGIVGTTGWRVCRHPDVHRYDLSSMVQVGGGGAPISPALQARLREVFPNAAYRVGIGYGSTETTSLVSNAGGPELIEFPDTVGKPLPTMEVEIRDADGKPRPEGEEGDIFARGPLIMLEYWRRPEATAETIVAGRWLRTGDIGRLEGGRLFLSSRRRDLILRGGENVYPVEIENVLEAHPDVAESAVLGVPHEELGQEVLAIVVPKEGRTLVPADLARFVAGRLAAFKVPAHWEIRNVPLPRTETGKVQKHLIEPTFTTD